MSSCVISHHNCDYDTNCGLTCEGVYQREVLSDPGFAPPPGHYEDFIAMCLQYYFPGGCSGSSLSDSSFSFELSPAMVDSINAAFATGFLGGVLSALPAVFCMVAVLVVVYLFAYATKPKGGS